MKLEGIRIIGFDLDQTLYPKSPEIDSAIQEYIYARIAEHKQCSIDEAKDLFCELYPAISGSQTLMKLGVPDAREVVQKALENADIDEYLKPDPQVHSLLNELKQRYDAICLITGSYEQIALRKLEKLGIDRNMFDFFRTGEVPKSDGTAYNEWLDFYRKKDPSIEPSNFLYVGDRKSTDVDVPALLGIQAVLVNVAEKDPSVEVPQLGKLVDIGSLLL
jgi:FMN phosphatase YigB (HAD superfamily)